MSIKNEVLKLKLTSTGAFEHPSSAVKLIGVILAPVILLLIGMRGQNNVPWYLLTLGVLGFLAILMAGFFLFARDDHSDDFSISPRNR